MNKIKILSKILVVFMLVFSLTFVASNTTPKAVSSSTSNIWTPRGHNPAFVLPSGTITVEVKSSVTLPTTGWTAQLQNDLRSWNCTVNSVVAGSINHGTQSGYIFTITVPSNVPPELFTLVLNDTVNGGSISSTRSVKVESSFDDSFYIMQITDEHIAPGAPTYGDGRNSSGTSSIEMKNWVAPVINTINPRFVLYTGDNTHQYYSATSWRGMSGAIANQEAYMAAMQAYKVPSVIINGNHDIGWSDYTEQAAWEAEYERIMGQRAFSFRMGAFYVNASEFTLRDWYDWSVNDWNAKWSDPSITFRLQASHFYDGDSGWTTVSKADKPANMMLVGHNHSTATVSSSPYKVYSLQSAQAWNTTGFYNFNKSGNTWTCPQLTSRTSGVDYFTLFSGDYGTNLKVTTNYGYANDGTRTSNSCAVVNNINQRFYNGRVRFLMARGTYAVTGGTILSQYDYGTNGTAVVVKVDIQPSATTNVSIAPASTSSNLLQNPGFENDFTNWIVTGNASITTTAAEVHQPSTKAAKSWASTAYTTNLSNTLTNVTAGTYTAKVWSRGSGTFSVRKYNVYVNGNQVVSYTVPLSTTYTEYTASNAISVPAGATVKVEIALNANGGAWTQFDDFSFTKN